MAQAVLKLGEDHQNKVKFDLETRRKLRTITDFKARTRSVGTAWTHDYQ